jgi:hypothetical protein
MMVDLGRTVAVLEQIHARHLARQTVGTGFSDVGDMVTVLLDSASEKVARSPNLRTARSNTQRTGLTLRGNN